MPIVENISTAKDIAIDFFGFLEKQNVQYVVVGSFDPTESGMPGDIDLVIQAHTVQEMYSLVRNFCQEKEMYLTQIIQHEFTAAQFLVQKSVGQNMVYCELDLCTHFVRNGRFYLQNSFLLTDRIRQKLPGGFSYFTAAPEREFLYYLIKKFDKGELSAAQFSHLTRQWKSAPQKCEFVLEEYFPQGYIQMIQRHMKNEEYEAFSGQFERLCTQFYRQLPFRFPWFLRDLQLRFKRFWQPTGYSVAFFGADGAGKTTAIKETVKFYAAFRRTRYFHLSPGFLKEKEASSSDFVPPHEEAPRSGFLSQLKLLYLFLEYSLGWVFKVRPFLMRSYLVFFDRYFHDILVDPIRYRHGAGLGLAQLVEKLIPRPHAFFLLDAPATVLQSRKQEVSMEESQRARQQYQKVFQGQKHTHIIDASRTIPEIAQEIRMQLMLMMHNRIKQRWK